MLIHLYHPTCSRSERYPISHITTDHSSVPCALCIAEFGYVEPVADTRATKSSSAVPAMFGVVDSMCSLSGDMSVRFDIAVRSDRVEDT